MATPQQRRLLHLGRGGAVGIAPFSVVGSDVKNGTALTLQPAVPVGNVGDLLLVGVSRATARTVTMPGGWTLREDPLAATFTVALYSRVADGSEGATIDVSLDQSAVFSVILARLRGVGAFDVDGSASDAGTTTSPAAPSIATSGPNRVLIGLWGVNGGRTITPPASMTQIAHQGTSPAILMAYELVPAAGAIGTRTATYTSTAVRSVSILAAFARSAA
jgi:hypothetical protein